MDCETERDVDLIYSASIEKKCGDAWETDRAFISRG